MRFDVVEPILGFEEHERFDLKKIDETFVRLQSIDAEEPSFTLINPFILREYAFDLPTQLQEKLEIDGESNILIFNIVMIQNPIEKSTINFAAPLIFNTDAKKMAQFIIDTDPTYGLNEPLENYLSKDNA